MTYKRLYEQVEENYVQIKKIELPKGIQQNAFQGKSLLNMGTPIIYLKNEDGYLPDFLSGGTSMLVISSKVKKFLMNSSEKEYLECIETNVISKKGNIENYFLLNILSLFECFDFKNSVYELYEEYDNAFKNIKIMKIDSSKVNNRKLFHMKEFLVEIFIEQSFVEQMLAAGIRDMRPIALKGAVN